MRLRFLSTDRLTDLSEMPNLQRKNHVPPPSKAMAAISLAAGHAISTIVAMPSHFRTIQAVTTTAIANNRPMALSYG